MAGKPIYKNKHLKVLWKISCLFSYIISMHVHIIFIYTWYIRACIYKYIYINTLYKYTYVQVYIYLSIYMPFRYILNVSPFGFFHKYITNVLLRCLQIISHLSLSLKPWTVVILNYWNLTLKRRRDLSFMGFMTHFTAIYIIACESNMGFHIYV